MRILHISTIKFHPCFLDVIYQQGRSHEVIFFILNSCDNPQYNVTSRYNEDGVTYIHINIKKDFDFEFDLKFESKFSKFLKEFAPDVIHMQLFTGLNVRSILRASFKSSAKKVITLHIHSLFCLPGVCFDKGEICPMNTLDECSCEGCTSTARINGMSLSKYNQTRQRRLEEIVLLVDVIICCSQWQRDIIQHLTGMKEKMTVLYYGVKISRRNEFRKMLTSIEIEKAGINWKSFVRKVTQYGWGKRVNSTIIHLFEKDGIEMNELQKVLGNDLKRLMSIIKPPLKKVRKKTSLPVFGYLGNMWDIKGFEVLLKSVQQLDYLKFKVLMGIRFERTNARDIAQLRKLKGFPKIQLIANLESGDFYEKFFTQIDYLIIPSLWEETGPMTLFESLYFKTPVIISNRSSMIEKTTEGVNSLIFENADTLAGIMRNIIEGRVPLMVRSRKNFPVKTTKMYAAILEKIYLGKPVKSYMLP